MAVGQYAVVVEMGRAAGGYTNGYVKLND